MIKLILENLVGGLILLLSLFFMFLVVPEQKIREFFNIGLVGGLVLALILVYLMQNMFGFWNFHNVDIIVIGDIPLLLSVAWLPIIIIFSYLVVKFKTIPAFLSIILSFPLAAVVVHYFLIDYGLLSYTNWNLLYTFLASLLIHLGITYYIYRTNRLPSFNQG
ncbi:hypothetical protein MWH28_11960 [Natroniella sulfidigena]|uniref:hypothetical protein n=1 Tax=Natroniella sulfidigena TaxID=723921 RepID=UPI00200B2011|nr:hypothetical protein [Natroniella sulfidigena]MCK8818073.1 hypothetical protein [Natroniella sulfidigena]